MPLILPQINPLFLGVDAAGTGSVLPTANSAYFVSVYLPAPATLTGVRCRFGTAAVGFYDVGIYADNAGVPGLLLAHAATTATSLATATGVVATPGLIGGNLALQAGRYWLALWMSSASDNFTGTSGASAGAINCMTGANGANPLPANASTITPVNTQLKPTLIGILSGGWS
jgi:hypothetical protein